jgi:hypothetical protein
MTCQQSFYRLPILRPIGTQDTERASWESPISADIQPWWLSHPSFQPPDSSRYKSDLWSVGWEGGPTSASVVFRQGYGGYTFTSSAQPRDPDAYCPCNANCLTTLVIARRASQVQDPQTRAVDEAADGVVTVKAFFYNKDSPTQRLDGIFLRMKTAVVPFLVAAVSDSIPSYFSEDRTSQLGLFSQGVDSKQFFVRGKPSAIMSYSDDSGLYNSRSSMQYLGGNPSPFKIGLTRGKIYHQALHTFEFGTITGGSLNVQETQCQVDCANRYLTLGMDRQSAFACVGSQPVNDVGLYQVGELYRGPYNPGPFLWNGFVPRVFFSPVVVNASLGDDWERYRPLECLDKHPLRFEIEVTSESKTLFLDSDARSSRPPISVRLPNLTAIPYEGREVHDIRARVATSTAASRASSFAAHEQYCFLSAMTSAAEYKAAEISYWPASQPKTDIALPIGSAACANGINAGLSISLSHDEAAKAAAVSKRNQAVAALREIVRNAPETVPRWPATISLGGEVRGLPVLPANFDSMFDEYGRSKYNWFLGATETTLLYLGTKLGHFGDLSVKLRQQAAGSTPTQSQWSGVITPNARTPAATTGADPQTYTTTFSLYTSDVLWPEWNQKLYVNDPLVSDWNILWSISDIDNQEFGSDGVVRPYKPFNNRNTIRSFITDEVVLGFRLGEDFTRYHFVDEHEADKQGDADLKGIPPGPDLNGTSFTQRWIEAKAKFRQDVVDLWTRCGNFSESVQVTMHSELRSLEARAQFVHNAFNYNATLSPRITGESGHGAGSAGGQNDVVTAEDPMLRLGLLGNVCDVTKVDVYLADVSFGEPTDVLVEGKLWRGFDGLRETPHIRKYSVPCTVTFFTTKKTPTKVIEIYRPIGDSGLDMSEFKISSDTGNLYQWRESLYSENKQRHGITSYSVNWD